MSTVIVDELEAGCDRPSSPHAAKLFGEPRQSPGSADKREARATGTDPLTGKYLTFLLGREEFAIQVLKVREIMGIQDITAVPQTPSYVKGVINLRGKVIPVVDLRLKF